MTNEAYRDVVLLSTVGLARNYQDLPFPSRMDGGDVDLVLERAGDALSGVKAHFEFERLSEMSSSRKTALCDRQLIEKSALTHAERAAALTSTECGMAITLCAEDHMMMQTTWPGLHLSEAYEADSVFDRLLDQRGVYAFDEQFGYLTSRLEKCGTGLRAAVTLHLPALVLSKGIRDAVQDMASINLSLQPGSGENYEAFGQYYRLVNRYSLGRSEEEILSACENATLSLITRERAAREELMQQDSILLQDRVFRSAAVLSSARILSVREMMMRLSDLRLGVSLGLFDLPLDELDQLNMSLRPASMRNALGEQITDRMLDEERARALREFTASIP